MKNEIIVTPSEFRDLVKNEKLEPEDVFDEETLKLWRESRNYADAVMAMAKADLEKKQAQTANPYIDPAQNPLIPGQEDIPETKKENEDVDKYLDPAQNPLIRTGDE